MPTNPYYQEAFAGASGQTARAEQVKSEFDGVQAGFNAAYAADEQAVKGAVGEVLDALPAAASRVNMWLRFDANGQPSVVSSPLNPRGAWAANTAYAVGDAFTAAPNNSMYYVQTAYTSGATFGSTDLANTEIIVNLGGMFFANYQIIDTAGTFNLVAGGSYFVDTTSGDIWLDLPTGNLGDSPINVTHVGGSLGTGQTLTINSASGQYLMGTTDNLLVVDVVNASMTFAYGGAAYGWRLRTMG